MTVQPADRGDTSNLETTLLDSPDAVAVLSDDLALELVADKGYHSNSVLVTQKEAESAPLAICRSPQPAPVVTGVVRVGDRC